MDLGSNFGAKLEPFLLIAKSVKGAAAVKLIQDATAAPGVFVFSELLELPNIQEVCTLCHQQLVVSFSRCSLRRTNNLTSIYYCCDSLPIGHIRITCVSSGLSLLIILLLISTENKDNLPPLIPAQITKLKHLSLVTLASDRRVCTAMSPSCSSLNCASG